MFDMEWRGERLAVCPCQLHLASLVAGHLTSFVHATVMFMFPILMFLFPSFLFLSVSISAQVQNWQGRDGA